jgi:muramoyltetrapeptide carboxypeptidase
MTWRAPWRLEPGSRVAVVAPAGAPQPEAYAQGLALLEQRYAVIRRYTLSPEAGERAQHLPYLAADDAARAAALNDALADPEVEAVICARGGYGCSRILEALDGEALGRRRIPLVGFSDITALHAWAAGLGLPSIHGPVVTQLPRLPDGDRAALFELLEGGAPTLSGLEPLSGGRASGLLVGGNLSLLCHLLGTPWAPELQGRILLLEEIGESPYRLDRLLTQLSLAGVFQRVAAVVLGQLQGCDAEQGVPPTRRFVSAREVLQDRLGAPGIPVVLDAPVGHGQRNVALPLGAVATLDADAGRLSFD